MWGSTTQKDKENHSLTEESQKERYEEFLRVKKKYPEWVPIIIKANDVILTKHKYLTRKKIQFKAFAEIVRKYCLIPTSKGTEPIDARIPLYFVANDTLIPPDEEMVKVYEIHKKNDGFLHIGLRIEPDWVAPILTQLPMVPIENYRDNVIELSKDIQNERELPNTNNGEPLSVASLNSPERNSS
jgi:hypothetical protein